MVHETIDGAFCQTNLNNESDGYLTKRGELRLAEIELMQQRERVAELRRHLPPGPALEDYKFIEGPVGLDSGDAPTPTVRLSELFTSPGRPLAIYHLMFGKRQVKPCPMCTACEDREGNQDSTISVFTLDGPGVVHHFYSAHPRMSQEIKERGIDPMSPIWHVLDLTPQGRGDWYAKLEYPKTSHA